MFLNNFQVKEEIKMEIENYLKLSDNEIHHKTYGMQGKWCFKGKV